MPNKINVFVGSVICLLVLATVVTWRNGTKKNLTTPQSNKKVTIILDWSPNTNHTGIYVAKEKGYFAKEHLDVRILQQANDASQAVATGKIDFAISSQESVIQARVK